MAKSTKRKSRKSDSNITLRLLSNDEISIRWRDVFNLAMASEKLNSASVSFLDVFEKCAFPNGEEGFYSGQEILAEIAETLSGYPMDFKNQMQNAAEYSVDLEQGILIKDHDKVYVADNIFTKSFTVTPETTDGEMCPISIWMGSDYLKKSAYKDVNGRAQRNSVDGVLIHEIGHVWCRTVEEKLPCRLEDSFITAMGKHNMDFDSFYTLGRRQENYSSLLSNIDNRLLMPISADELGL